MKKITFECELITPMFMYGGNGKTLELRPSEFKGMLRFWWRALHPELSVEDLKKKEGEIFGNTSKRSSFKIKINGNLQSDRYYLLPHKNKANIPSYKPNQRFILEILSLKDKYKELIQNLFILSTAISGFGKRSRRGFGSIKITRIDNNTFNYEYYLSIEKIERLIKTINPNFRFNFRKKKEENYPFIKNIEIGNKAYNSYDEVLKYIGQLTHDCRCGKSGVFKNLNRFASPCYVSVIKNNDKYYPIITSLSITLPGNENISKNQLNTMKNFKISILENKNLCKTGRN